MYKEIKIKLLLISLFICIFFSFANNNIYALTQQEVGEAIATFALNFQKAPDGGQTWTYDYNAKNRSEAYHGRKHSDGTYHADCVGWASMCLHLSIGLDHPNVASGACGFVTPDKYTNITYPGRADGSVIEKVKGKLMPGDILTNSHHVMIYVGNIDGKDMIVHSDKSGELSYDSFESYKKRNSTGSSDIQGTYQTVWRMTEEYAATLTESDLNTTWNGSNGDYTFGESGASAGNGSNGELENFEGYPDYEIKEDDTRTNFRIVNINDKIPMYKHILMTEKYNFNNIKWARYGHGYDGSASPTKDDLTLGLKYPSDENNTKLGKFVSMVLPYIQTWYIPLGMYSGILTSSSGMPLSGNAYSGDAVYSGANNQEMVWNFLISKGLSEVSAAAIMGNIACEAGINFNPAAIEQGNNNAGFGLCQWSYGRRTAIIEFAEKQGKEPDDITLQLDFLWLEMSGEDPEVPCQFLGDSSFEEFREIDDIDTATNYFCDEFERPNAEYAHKDRRREQAHMFYEKFSGTFIGASTVSGSNIVVASGSFNTFELTENQLKALATVCQSEQGTTEGAAAEASLMANHMDLNTHNAKNYPDTGEGLYNYVKKGGWFHAASSYMDSYVTNDGSALRDDVIEAVRSVLVGGKRTLPGYIDEHDWIKDIVSVENNGTSVDKNNRDNFIQHETVLKNGNGAEYIFYSFPNEDPFGYTSKKNREEIGDFHYEFDSGASVGGFSNVEIPKAARNINFPYSLIKNGYHEIIVNRYDMQKHNLKTKYRDYDEITKRSEGTFKKTIVKQINPETGLWVTVYSYTDTIEFNSSVEISRKRVNTRKDENGNVDPMLEEQVASSTDINTQYYLHRAFTFDMVYTNEFDYIKYSDEDVASRKNADSESEVDRQPYKKTINEENKMTDAEVKSKGISNAPGSTSYIGYTDEYSADGTQKIETYTISYKGPEYIEHDGEEIYINRMWTDRLTQGESKDNQVDYEEMIKFNENEENKSNRSTITKEEFESSEENEYKIYKQVSKEGELNLIDLINSNPKLISTYLNDTAKQSEYMGYTREDDLLMSYEQLRRLVERSKNDSGVVPYAYFISLGQNMGFGNSKANINEISGGGGYGWPVNLESNDGARVINAIYPYTPAYGGEHYGIDIAPGNGKNEIIAAKDGVVSQVLIDDGSGEGYGNAVLLEHADGTYTRYAHLSSIQSDIVKGTEVKRADVLGIMGTTGNSTGVHLHFEIMEGGTSQSNTVDPLDYYVTEPEYGSIDPKTITGIPSGYKFLSEKATGGPTGSTSTGKIAGKTNILIAAGHTVSGEDVRGYADSGYDETRETRKLAIALSNAINAQGMNAVIANRVLAGNKDAYVDDVIWGNYSLYNEGRKDSSIYDQFEGYDHAIEIHFNAANGSAYGALLVSPSESSITELDKKLLNAVGKYVYKENVRSPSIQGITDITQLRKRNVSITYLETEFYDNKTAMDYTSKNYEAMAQEMAKVLKEHFQ